MKALEVVDAHLIDVEKHLGSKKGDLPSLYGVVREESGLKFELD